MKKQDKPNVTTTKKTYRKPNLVRYGDVQKITKGGSVDSPEGKGTGNENKMP